MRSVFDEGLDDHIDHRPRHIDHKDIRHWKPVPELSVLKRVARGRLVNPRVNVRVRRSCAI